jgi:hypothetical protein
MPLFSGPRAIVTVGGAEQANAGMAIPVTLPLYPFPSSKTVFCYSANSHDEYANCF